MPRITSLYNELAQLGRVEKSMHPSVFVAADGKPKYERILDSPVVQRRAGTNPTASELAQHAHQAIQDAITTIYVPLDKAIVKAVLCATNDYRGLTVEERLGLLADKGVTRDMYKRRRRVVLRRVAEYLEGTVQPTNATIADDEENYLCNRLQLLAQAAANFHVAGLVGRLIADPNVTTHKIKQEFGTYQVADPAAYSFETFAELLRALDDDDGHPLFAYPTWRPGAYLPIESSADVRDRRYQPAPYEEVKAKFDKQLARFNQLEKMLGFDTREALVNIIQSFLARAPFSEEHWLITYYAPKPLQPRDFNRDTQLAGIFDLWRPWYTHCITRGATVELTTLTLLCAKSGAIWLMLEKHLGSFVSVMDSAASMALDALPYYFGLHNSIMLDDGTKLNDSEYTFIAERYFRKTGRELAKSYLATYGSSDYGVLARC